MGFEPWQDPREAAAAAEVARRAEAERAVQDARTATVAEAVRLGFADLAAAIVTAAGPEALRLWRQQDLCLPGSRDCGLGIDPDTFNDSAAQPDSDIDDLIDNQQ